MTSSSSLAEANEFPFERISLEMLGFPFYHLVSARAQGYTQDGLRYLISEENQEQGWVKPLRPGRLRPTKNLSPFPCDRIV